MYLEATAPLNFPQGVLTSTVDTFINDGTTTEYMTQHIGTAINDVYAKIQTTSSREYYRIAPTASQNYNAPARPTGLIGSSTSLDIHGPVSTYYTIEEYRTYVDGHYAHLVSSITNVVTDTEQIKPTPAFGYDAYLNTDDQEAEQRIKDSVFSSYGIGGNNPSIAAVTRTIGHSFFHEDSKLEEAILNEINDYPGTIKRPRQVDIDDLVAIESEANEIEIDPSKPVQALPTFTVDHNGQLNIPTPKIEVLTPITEKQKPARQHRFLPQDKPEKSTMASVTYIGFVDFTTTIDDTVVIFKPKNNYNTATKNIFPTRIEPTSSFTPSFTSSARPAIGQVKLPKAFDFNARPGLNIVDNDQVDKKESVEEEDDSRKHTSGINALKSLLSSSAALRSSVYNTVSRSRFSIVPSSSVPVFVSPTLSPSGELEPVGYEITESPLDLLPSIDPSADVELVFKTLYTTFTYFTTFFKESTTRVKSRLEIISNVNTLTNILKSTDLPAISSSCELDSSCLFASDASGYVGRPNTRLFEQPRSQDGKPVSFNIIDDTVEGDLPRSSVVPNYFYTTYTYFNTIFDENSGKNTTVTSTDVYSNINTESIPIGVVTPVTEILPTSSAKITLISEASNSPAKSSISAFPVRRLEVSSIKDRQLQRELTTPETTEETTTNSLIDTSPTEESVFTIDAIEVSTVQTETTKNDGEAETDSVTNETPGLTEEVTEVSTTATTESSELNIDAESVLVAPRTLYTTFTYLTTFFKDSTSTVLSNLETITNIATDGNIQPTLVDDSVTFFTTLTYWTTIFEPEGTVNITTSSEETITNILPGSAAFTSLLETALPGSNGEEINATPPTNNFIEQTVFSFPTASITEDLDGSEEFSTGVPILQSSEGEEDKSVFDTLATSSQFSLTSSQGFDDDDDFVLTTESNDDEDENESEEDENESRGRGTVRPSRVRNKVLFSRPGNSGNTFTPVIRPNLGNRQIPRLFKPSRTRISTTVATRTKNSVKPTLIATPASSAAVNTPLFDPSSRFLSSANFLSRGQSRFSSSQLRGSSIPISTSAFGGASESINPSSVLQRGSKTFSSEITETTTTPAVFSGLLNRRPNPFRARLKQLQQERLKKLQEANKIKIDDKTDDENDNDDNDSNSLPIPNFPSIPGGKAPIFVSSQRQTITRRPNTEAPIIDIPDDIKERRERARERIKSLFAQRRPFGVSRQKRQVYGSDFGDRTERRQSYIFRRSQSYPYTSSSQSSPSSSSYSQPQYFLNKDNPPFTAFRHSPAETSINYDNDNIFNDNDDLYSSNLVPGSDVTKQQFRRQVSSDTRSRSRFRSRNTSTREETTSSPALTRTRTRFRDTRFRDRATTTPPPTTTPSAVSRFSRFRPRTFSTDSRSINSFGSTRNQNLFNRDSTRSRFGTTDTSSTRNGLFSRPQVIDYSDYDYYDYADTDLQSSSEDVPDYITVTHQVPIATQIPVVEFGRTEIRDILSTSPSLEVVAVTALKSTDINNSPVIYANAHTFTTQIGVQDILFDALRATETTRIEFTPTLIRGRRTQFSHIIPSTIYNVETVTTQIVEQVDQNQLLNSLLQHLLLGNSQSPVQSTPALPAINSAVAPLIVPSTPVTNLITHTSTYVTTITEEESTVLPITLRGKAITTTIIESSTKVVTATEYSTETQVHTPLVAPTIPNILAPILQTQAPVVPGLNQQLASLLPAILGSGGNPLLQQQQEQQALQQQQVLALQQQEALLAKKLQEQQQAQQIAREQEALNEQLLAKINLDDFTEEDLANLDIDAVLEAVSNQDLGVIFPKKNLFDNIQPTAVAAPAAGPSTSLLTIFKSGDRPGEFTSLVSTIVLDGRRIKRDVINPTTVQPIQKTELPQMNQIELFELGAARGPVDIDLDDSFILDSLPPNLVPSIDISAHSTIQP